MELIIIVNTHQLPGIWLDTLDALTLGTKYHEANIKNFNLEGGFASSGSEKLHGSPWSSLRAGMKTWVFLLTVPCAFHVAASPVSMSNHGGHFHCALRPWFVFVSGGLELPKSQRALSPQAHTYWAFSMTCILLWWALYRKPVKRKKKKEDRRKYMGLERKSSLQFILK